MLNRSLGTSSKKFARLADVAGELVDFCQALYPLLVVNADDHGRLPGDAFSVKFNVFPISRHSEDDFERALEALHRVELVALYEIDGRRYLYVHNFRREQPGIKYVAKSHLPEPPPEVLKKERFTGFDQDFGNFPIEEKRREKEIYISPAGAGAPSPEVAQAACEPSEIQEPGALLAIYCQHNQVLPQAKALTPEREEKCRSRINQAARDGCLRQYFADFEAAVIKAQTIPYLRGEGKDHWRASFDWFVGNHTNVYKILEGNFMERANGNGNGHRRAAKPRARDPGAHPAPANECGHCLGTGKVIRTEYKGEKTESPATTGEYAFLKSLEAPMDIGACPKCDGTGIRKQETRMADE